MTPSIGNRRASGAVLIAGGILVSRGLGFLRDAVLAYFFGAGPHADVFRTALRGPNVLQNLLGEQTLSASFIPVYSRMLEDGRERDAGRFAGAIFGLLLAVAATLSLIGILLARPIVSVLAPGYLGDAAAIAAGEATVDRFELSVRAVRFIFPMTGLLVLSAWCLGILNSHRRFFLPYVAPALWNAAIIAALWMAGRGWFPESLAGGSGSTPADGFLMAACVGALAGGLLQCTVQLPAVIRLSHGLRPSLSLKIPGVRETLGAFAPLLAGRGVVQLSGYVDLVLASLLAAGAVGSLGYAQTLYLLPVSLFGMSVAAAELPELARRATPESVAELRDRVGDAWRQMIFLTLPTAVGFVLFGFVLVAALFRRGSFGAADNWLVYCVLAAYSLGLVASNTSRLLNNVFYSRLETRTPAWIAVRRVLVSLVLGIPLMFWLDGYPVVDVFGVPGQHGLRLGAVGLALAAAIAAWFELWLLGRRVSILIEGFRLPSRSAAPLAVIALTAALPAGGLWWLARDWMPLLQAAIVLPAYAAVYLGASAAFGMSELGTWTRRLGRRR